MPTLLNYAIHQAVERDGLPRVGRYDDGSQQVLFLEGDTVRSLATADWLSTRGPLPTDPTDAQIAAAIAAREAARQQAMVDVLALRQRVLTIAAGAVGKSVDTLTAGEVRALLVCLLYRAGGIDKAGVVQPLGLWM